MVKAIVPLAELPSNHSARNGVGQPQDDAQDDTSRTGTPNGDENLDMLKNPSSIQGMLRNTTETGNVGQFSIRPSRVTPSLPRPSKARMIPGKQRQPGAYYSRNEHGNIRHSQIDTHTETTISNSSGVHTQIPRPPRGPARSPSIEDYRSYSTTKSSYTSPGFSTHHPLINGGHVGPGGTPNIRPRSPFAYPTRLKRPGYRPSSPALSELNKQDRSQTSLHRRPSFRTNSPSSLHTNRAPSPWRKGVNRSDPLLRYYPQSTLPISARAPSPSPNSTRLPTPKGSPSLNSIPSSTNTLQTARHGSWINPQSPTHSPIFYDYTEAFGEQGVEQQDYSHYVSMSTGTLAEQPMLDTATTTYYELDVSPDTTELLPENSFPKPKTQATDNRFDQTTSQFEVNDESSIHALHKDLSEVPELPEGDCSTAEFNVTLAKHSDSPVDQESQYPLPEQSSPLKTTPEPPKQLYDQEKRQRALLNVENTRNTSRNSESSNRQRSSPVKLLHSTHSALQPTSEREDSSPRDSMTKSSAVPSPPPVRVGLTAAESDLDEGPANENRHSMPLVRASSFEDPSVYEHTITDIISPTPERSITSPTSVGRFSKILSINDDLLDLDELANRIKGKDRADSPMQGIMDSRARVARVEPPWRKRSVQLRDIATRQKSADFALVEASDSEDEPELTQGLRQTFCKSDDHPLVNRPRSPPITLPSQLVHRGYPGPLSIRRSPAVRRSTSDLRKVRDSPDAHTDRDRVSVEGRLAHVASTLEAKQSSPEQLTTDQDFKSPEKLSIQEHSAPDIKPSPPPLPPPNKELPSLPNERPVIVSLSPPIAPRLPSLPFSFTPLLQRRSEDETASVAELEAVALSYLDQSEKTHEDKETAVPISATELTPVRNSIASLPDSRPWNLDTNYPWNDQQPKPEVIVPDPTEDSDRSTGSFPRFRFKVQRASSITQGTGKIMKCPQPSIASSSLFASSRDVFQGATFRPKRHPTLAIMPGQINSSHDVVRSSPSQTRFVESFETQSPRITLVPPSPGFEARSFFSDDSSQVTHKGVFKKRISALRNRRSRGPSVDEPRGYDRGLLNSALGRSRASGRSSRQSENTAMTAGASSRASHTKRARRKLVNKLRSWWQRGEDRVREWRWRRRYNGAIGRSVSADLYAGV